MLLLATMCVVGKAYAFDTGPHFDITEDVLRSEGFSSNAIMTVQSANFFVDFYEFIGNKSLTTILDPVCRARVDSCLAIGDRQHFDELQTTREVAEKWDEMLDATKSTAAAQAKSGDILGLLALLGMSLHNVQDFYAHSNWVEGSPMGPPLGQGALAKYGDHPTWLSVDRADRQQLYVYTRKDSLKRWHGDWDSGPDAINKDWIGRPHHRDAYICAYFATRQWVRLFQNFVSDPAVWSKMQQFGKGSFDPSRDWDYARKISFYGGHWNGNGGPKTLKEAFSKRAAATSPDLLFNAVLDFMGGTCIDKKLSALRSKAQDLLLTWGRMPYHGPVDPTLPSAAPEHMQFVLFQVHSINLVEGGDGLLGGEMDWYSRANIGGQHFWSCLIDEHDNFNFVKPYAPWTMIKAVPPGTGDVPIRYEQMELDYVNDDWIDVNPQKGKKELTLRYAPATGTVSGDFSGNASFNAIGKGDCDCARINVTIDTLSGSCLR